MSQEARGDMQDLRSRVDTKSRGWTAFKAASGIGYRAAYDLKFMEWAKRHKAQKARAWTNAELARAQQLSAPQPRTQDQLQCYREP